VINDGELSRSLLATEAKRLRCVWRLTPEQRMERFVRLQAIAEQTLASNPRAYSAFQRRNHHRRRLSQVGDMLRRLQVPALEPSAGRQ
jgi:hypothetical protein